MTFLLAQGAPSTSVTPVDAAANSILGYILGYGPLGLIALALAFRWLVPGRTAEKDRANARADLERENGRLLERAEKAEKDRDEALKIAQDKLIPLLSEFTSVTGALTPILQELVFKLGGGHDAGRARR